jgi:diguanylate cyclase (GGDEF)-like protein
MVGADALNQSFPKISVSEELDGFFESFAEKRDRFAVLVIRIDEFESVFEQLGETITTNLLMKLARVIDNLSKTTPMVWGRVGQDEFACLCQDMDEASGVELAKEIQRRLQLTAKQTASIGLAVYPFWPFEKTAILDNARKALDHAAFFGPNTVTPFDAVSLNISADKLYQYGDIEGAIEEFKKALAVDPKDVNVQNSLGVCHGVKGDFDLAIDAFETAIHLNPEDVMATFNLGLAHFKEGNKEKALDLFLSAHRLDGENPEVAYQIGTCYQEKNQLDEALKYFELAAAGEPKGGHVFRSLGECYFEKELLKDATKAFEKAIRFNPRDAKSLSALGYLYGSIGENLEIAIVLCRESAEIEPDSGLYRFRLGKLYQQSSEYGKAMEQFKKAEELGEDCSEVMEEMGALTAEEA